MSYPPNTPFNDVFLAEGTASIATSPVVAVIVSPVAGILRKVFAASNGTTTGTIAVAVSINGGSDITSGGLTIAAGAGGNNPGLDLPKIGASAHNVAEGDVITFTPSGGTGAAIAGAFTAVIRKT
jgi:hypothetical protein